KCMIVTFCLSERYVIDRRLNFLGIRSAAVGRPYLCLHFGNGRLEAPAGQVIAFDGFAFFLLGDISKRGPKIAMPAGRISNHDRWSNISILSRCSSCPIFRSEEHTSELQSR